ncbi:MAG: branched-chain amino acid ABC transporter permease [Chthonomonas sp.]|nr:branched-chain amino acid ABC transporter permease [Chthonomonas sp.]
MKFALIRVGSIALAILGAFAFDTVVKGALDSFAVRLVFLAGLYVTLAVSLNLINGVTGQFSIGHAAFYQVGAYAAAYLSINYFAGQSLSAPVWIIAMLVVGAIMASLAGLIVGLPSLRLRGDYLAIATLGFGEIIRIVVQNTQELGAARGLSVSPKVEAPLWLAVLLATVCIAVCRNLLKVAHGLTFLAVRDDEVASSAMGINVTKTKVVAFLVGSAFAGSAGALMAHNSGFIEPNMFTMETSFVILTMVVLGGTGSITGATIAAIVLSILPEALRLIDAVTMSGLIGATISLIGTVVVLRHVGEHFHGKASQKAARIAGTLVGAVVVTYVLKFLLGLIPALASASVEGSKLRLVIFAATLIMVMLLRPQGVFAHHEFSWNWVRGLFRKTSEARA